MNPTRTGPKEHHTTIVKRSKHLKNLDCPHYNECLDMAAKLSWNGFTCKKCCHRDSTEGRIDIMDILPEQDGFDFSIPQRITREMEI